MRNQASRAIFDYWNDIKGNRAAPLRIEIDPAALRHLLPHLFIVAADPQGAMAFRLAGTRVCELFDRELRSASFAEIWLQADHRQPVEIARTVILRERPALLDMAALGRRQRHPCEMLLLPMRSQESARSDRLLGALLPRGARIPAADLPAAALELDNWTFLTGSDSHFGVPVIADHRGFPDALRRFLPARPSARGETS